MKAHFKFVHTAPRKVRLILDEIRGMSATVAESRLLFMPNQAARDIYTALHSAIHNAKDGGMETSGLLIGKAICDDGPRVKRRIMASRGRAKPITKQMSHILIELIAPKHVEKTDAKVFDASKKEL